MFCQVMGRSHTSNKRSQGCDLHPVVPVVQLYYYGGVQAPEGALSVDRAKGDNPAVSAGLSATRGNTLYTRPDEKKIKMVPADPFTILEPQDQEIVKFDTSGTLQRILKHKSFKRVGWGEKKQPILRIIFS